MPKPPWPPPCPWIGSRTHLTSMPRPTRTQISRPRSHDGMYLDVHQSGRVAGGAGAAVDADATPGAANVAAAPSPTSTEMYLVFILPSPSQDEARRSVLRITAAAVTRPAERPRKLVRQPQMAAPPAIRQR